MDRSDSARLDRREFVARLLGAGAALSLAPLACSHAPAPAPLPAPANPGQAVAPHEPVLLRHFSGATARISPLGARVTSWQRATGEEMLFSLPDTDSALGVAVGGIPVVFPEIGERTSEPAIDLLGSTGWEVADEGKDPSGAAYTLLRTSDSAATREQWPHAFRASLRVTLDEALSTALTIENRGDAPLAFQCGLWTHLRVGDLRRVTVRGLEGARYRDRLARGRERRAPRRPLTVDRATDRVYLRQPDRVQIRDAAREQTVLVDRAGFSDVVIANPGEPPRDDGMPAGESAHVLVVAAAQIDPVASITPGQLWSGVQRLRIGET